MLSTYVVYHALVSIGSLKLGCFVVVKTDYIIGCLLGLLSVVMFFFMLYDEVWVFKVVDITCCIWHPIGNWHELDRPVISRNLASEHMENDDDDCNCKTAAKGMAPPSTHPFSHHGMDGVACGAGSSPATVAVHTCVSINSQSPAVPPLAFGREGTEIFSITIRPSLNSFLSFFYIN